MGGGGVGTRAPREGARGRSFYWVYGRAASAEHKRRLN